MESGEQINDEEVKSVIEVMAASGKYWYAINLPYNIIYFQVASLDLQFWASPILNFAQLMWKWLTR